MVDGVKRAIVIGGGIGGLCVAIGLRQIGIEVSVYEQAPALGRVGAGLTVWANAIKALRKLGVADAVLASAARIERAEVRTARGRVLALSRPGELEARYGEPTVALHRADLHRALLAALPDDVLRLGEKCSHVAQDEGGVTVRFESGRTDHAGLLIAADGIHSTVRAQVFSQSKPRYAGYTSWRGIVKTEDEAALGVTSESWGCGSRFGLLRIDERHVYWFATANARAGRTQTADEQKEFLRTRFRAWHHPVGLLIDATPAEQILHTDIYDLEPMRSWSVGRVVLLGDAAHATTPNMGQGGCMAIESAVVLARCLRQEPGLVAALKRYEAERMPRTSWITAQSWKIGRIGQLENRFACMLRNLVFGLTPAAIIKKPLEQAVGFEA